MPVYAGQQSKFAVLKIDDDTSSSSEDESKPTGNVAGKARSGGNKKTGKGKNVGGLMVHVVPQKPKQKGKKAKKTQAQVVDADGFIVQDAGDDYLEKKFRDDLKEALANSKEGVSDPNSPSKPRNKAQTSKPKPPPEVVSVEEIPEKNAIEILVSDLDKQASVLMTKTEGASRNREKQMAMLYRSRLIQTLQELNSKTEEAAQAEGDASKYKNRYKRICELLRDAEVNEKAHLMAEVDKARKVEAEMGIQIGNLRGELMQAHTKIRDFQQKLREHDIKF